MKEGEGEDECVLIQTTTSLYQNTFVVVAPLSTGRLHWTQDKSFGKTIILYDPILILLDGIKIPHGILENILLEIHCCSRGECLAL